MVFYWIVVSVLPGRQREMLLLPGLLLLVHLGVDSPENGVEAVVLTGSELRSAPGDDDFVRLPVKLDLLTELPEKRLPVFIVPALEDRGELVAPMRQTGLWSKILQTRRQAPMIIFPPHTVCPAP